MPPLLRRYLYIITKNISFEPLTIENLYTALDQRDKITASMEEFLSQWDAWLCPVTSTAAFTHMTPSRYSGPQPIYKEPIYVDGQAVNYYDATIHYTRVFNATGNPVVILPMGYTQEGLPLGVQIVGRRWKDMELLQAAKLINDAVGAFKNPPGY
jgi:amidase